MTKTMMSFRLPSDTPDRLKALAQPGKSQAAVILRALAVLEGHSADAGPEQDQPHYARLEAIEARLEALEARLAPDDDGAVDYHPIIKRGSTADARRRSSAG
ncbi:MAG: LuxR family transcriptional regulator [Chromatiales bacterium]|nr:LuxR family transcriptional regulator [Chromatiales bacterium]